MSKLKEQLALPLDYPVHTTEREVSYNQRLVKLLRGDLNFHNDHSLYAAHNFHAFPAKFPPQLPQKFILSLTDPGDIVLDPMAGSGTTILEAYFANRLAIGFDIDPLALMISKTKVTPLNAERVDKFGYQVLCQARKKLVEQRQSLEQIRQIRWDEKSWEFIDYWFTHENQLELIALIDEIDRIPDPAIRLFLRLAFSAIIITKSGGVSLALDLAHTRPHRAKLVIDQNGREILREIQDEPPKHLDILTKNLRSPIDEFEKRYKSNLRGISPSSEKMLPPLLTWGDAQKIPLRDDCVDLIVTSPPYAANAIDYMRAHKFSLVWLGFPLEGLSQKRQTYIGGETVNNVNLEELPTFAKGIIDHLAKLDRKKGLTLHRYYSEMNRVLREMYRVLKPGKAAIVVVGSSIIRGIDTETQNSLAAIGKTIGFEVPNIGVRNLDRNRRMLPAGMKINLTSQIQQRMHEEYIIGFIKPGRGKSIE
jgi:DNA modification methylase